MKQEELTKKIRMWVDALIVAPTIGRIPQPDKITEAIMSDINAHVKEVIGEDERLWESGMGVGGKDLDRECRNQLRAEQRKRAGL